MLRQSLHNILQRKALACKNLNNSNRIHVSGVRCRRCQSSIIPCRSFAAHSNVWRYSCSTTLNAWLHGAWQYLIFQMMKCLKNPFLNLDFWNVAQETLWDQQKRFKTNLLESEWSETIKNVQNRLVFVSRAKKTRRLAENHTQKLEDGNITHWCLPRVKLALSEEQTGKIGTSRPSWHKPNLWGDDIWSAHDTYHGSQEVKLIQKQLHSKLRWLWG